MLLLFVSYECFAIEVHQNFSRIFMRTGVVYWLLFSFVCFFYWFYVFFSRVFGLVPPLVIFPLFLIKFDIGGIGWELIGVPTQLGCRCFSLMHVLSPGLPKKNARIFSAKLLGASKKCWEKSRIQKKKNEPQTLIHYAFANLL